jgi:hypothetical protein
MCDVARSLKFHLTDSRDGLYWSPKATCKQRMNQGGKQVSTQSRNEWNTKELGEDFIVEHFLAPYCFVTRKSDGAQGSVMFDHDPRRYYDFKETRS